MEVGINEGGELIRCQLLHPGDTPAIGLFYGLIVPPGQMGRERTILATIDHTSRHTTKLGIARQLLGIALLAPETSHLTAHGSIAVLSRTVDIIDL